MTGNRIGPFAGFSFSPSCSRNASRKVVFSSFSAGAATGIGAVCGSGVHSNVKSYRPVSPVSSTIGRPRPPTYGSESASRAIVVSREPSFILPFAEPFSMYAPQITGKTSLWLAISSGVTGCGFASQAGP